MVLLQKLSRIARTGELEPRGIRRLIRASCSPQPFMRVQPYGAPPVRAIHYKLTTFRYGTCPDPTHPLLQTPFHVIHLLPTRNVYEGPPSSPSSLDGPSTPVKSSLYPTWISICRAQIGGLCFGKCTVSGVLVRNVNAKQKLNPGHRRRKGQA